MVNWIMGCLSSVSFAIIINGSASGLFRPSRGLRQFYPLSPVLFLFIAEGLSTSILEAKRTGTLRGFKLVSTFYLTHFYLLMMRYLSVMAPVTSQTCTLSGKALKKKCNLIGTKRGCPL